MRYTTVIDISKLHSVYRNHNVRLLYLHLCLKAGYHDDDRDIVDMSLRRLASDCGLTLSATRHALKVLSDAQLVKNQEGIILVKKWSMEPSITPRKEERSKQNRDQIRKNQERENQERERLEAIQKEEARNGLQVYLQRLEARAAEGDIEAIETLKRRREQMKAAKSKET